MITDEPGIVMIMCPGTGQPIVTGIKMTRVEFAAMESLSGEAVCTACPDRHLWTKADAWVQLN